MNSAFQQAIQAIQQFMGGGQPQKIISPLPGGQVGFPKQGQVKGIQGGPTPTPTPNYDQRVTDIYLQQLGAKNPARQNPQEYFPVLKEMPYMRQLEQKYNRPGLADMMALQALFESTGGRATTNLFGVKPKGQAGQQFPNMRAAIDYQVSQDVLSGGVGNKLNILTGREGVIMPDEILQIYNSYNPNSPYVDRMIQYYKQVRGL